MHAPRPLAAMNEPPRTARVEPAQRYGFRPGTSMIQSFGSTQRRTLHGGAQTVADPRVYAPQGPLAATQPMPRTYSMPRATRFRPNASDSYPGPGAYSPPNVHVRSGSEFPKRSHQQPASRTGPAAAFNSTQRRVLDLAPHARREGVPGPIYDPLDAALSGVHVPSALRVAAALRAGGRPRWADLNESATFAQPELDRGLPPGVCVRAPVEGPGVGEYGRIFEWPPSPPRTAPPRAGPAGKERRFAPRSEGGARLVGEHGALSPGPAAYAPHVTHRGKRIGPAREYPTALPATAGFVPEYVPPPPRTWVPKEDDVRARADTVLGVIASGELDVAAMSAARWPTHVRALAHLEGRWRRTATT